MTVTVTSTVQATAEPDASPDEQSADEAEEDSGPALDVQGDPKQICLQLITNETELIEGHDLVAQQGYVRPTTYDEGFFQDIGGPGVVCKVTHSTRFARFEWGMFELNSGDRERLLALLGTENITAMDEQDGRTVLEVWMRVGTSEAAARYFSVGDHDVVFANAPEVWGHIIDL